MTWIALWPLLALAAPPGLLELRLRAPTLAFAKEDDGFASAESAGTEYASEPSSRLLPTDEDEPVPGPSSEPSRPAEEAQPSATEWRELEILRARRREGDRLRLGPGPKDPWRAVALSAEGTLAGILFPPLLTVGPAAGQAYAGSWTHALITSSLRTILVAGMAAATVWFAGVTLGHPASTGPVVQALSDLNVALVTGGLGVGALSAFDIATAYDDAVKANLRWERTIVGE